VIGDGCGAYAQCLAGDIVQFRNNLMQCYGLSHQLQGCQAEYIRVPPQTLMPLRYRRP
jgi:threonine dehydrogenase-like Zn-dependent dehydrogenase